MVISTGSNSANAALSAVVMSATTKAAVTASNLGNVTPVFQNPEAERQKQLKDFTETELKTETSSWLSPDEEDQSNLKTKAFEHPKPVESTSFPATSEERILSTVKMDLELREKVMAAGAAAVLSAILVNPLDVAKTRLQAQAAGQSRMQLATQALEYRGTFDVMLKVTRQEGVFRLWRGTNAALLLAVPSVGIYLPVYDVIRQYLEEGPAGTQSKMAPYAPLIAGSVSRSLAVVCCSPLELARTRMQAHRVVLEAPPGMPSILRDVWNTAREGPHTLLGRVRSLWTGVGAHLARDVPFSAICWASLEPIRRQLLSMSDTDPTLSQILLANVGAGVVSGALAAAVTTPLDVAKTRRQIEVDPIKGQKMSTVGTLLKIYRRQGISGLFTGMGPRVGRAAPSVAIVVSFYEIMKHTFKTAQP